MPDIEWLAVEFNRDFDAEIWRLRLADCDALVNCVGVLQSGCFDDSHRIHVKATMAMFRGAAAAGSAYLGAWRRPRGTDRICPRQGGG